MSIPMSWLCISIPVLIALPWIMFLAGAICWAVFLAVDFRKDKTDDR